MVKTRPAYDEEVYTDLRESGERGSIRELKDDEQDVPRQGRRGGSTSSLDSESEARGQLQLSSFEE